MGVHNACHSSTAIAGDSFVAADLIHTMALKYLAAILSLCACAAAIVGPSNSSKLKTDTYLEAYSKSRIDAEKAKQGVVIITAKDGEKKISNRDDSFGGYDYSPPHSGGDSFSSGFSGPSGSNSYSSSSSSYSPVKFESEITYNAPTNQYGPPAPSYGPPANTYGPPAHVYGPPAQTYGPPAHTYPPAHNYGPPAPQYGPPVQKPQPPAPVYGPPQKPNYGVPYEAPGFGFGFLDKLALKLDILTIAKLMLKFFIFKKLVTMLAVVCMLFIIPKLISFKKGDAGSDDGDERTFGAHKNVIELTSVQQFVERAISVYEKQQPDCGLACRVRRVIDDMYDFQPFVRHEAAATTS